MRAVAAAATVLWLTASAATALTPTPQSAGILPPGKYAVASSIGFPYLALTAQRGLSERFDLGLGMRTAWGAMQRVGVQSRMRLTDGPTSALALKAGADVWLGRPIDRRWIDVTGTQDLDATLGLLYSWTTPRGTVMTADATLHLIGNRQPRLPPLSGTPPWMALGANASVRIGAELPQENGLLFSFDLGLDLHTSGFDGALAMPAFSVGLGYIL